MKLYSSAVAVVIVMAALLLSLTGTTVTTNYFTIHTSRDLYSQIESMAWYFDSLYDRIEERYGEGFPTGRIHLTITRRDKVSATGVRINTRSLGVGVAQLSRDGLIRALVIPLFSFYVGNGDYDRRPTGKVSPLEIIVYEGLEEIFAREVLEGYRFRPEVMTHTLRCQALYNEPPDWSKLALRLKTGHTQEYDDLLAVSVVYYLEQTYGRKNLVNLLRGLRYDKPHWPTYLADKHLTINDLERDWMVFYGLEPVYEPVM